MNAWRQLLKTPNSPSEMLIGQAGEYIAAAALIEIGVQTMFSPTTGADLLAFYGKRYWRVEVKTTRALEKRENKKLYRWNTATGSAKKLAVSAEDADVLALVALDRRRVFFRRVDLVKGKTTRLSPTRFVEGVERQTWEEATSWT
jgi:Holliday junction resolvase